MPIRLEDLRAAAKSSQPIVGDRPCRYCNYNLIGLKSDQNCPECGKPISGPKDLPRYADQMVNAPLRWLKSFNLGCTMLSWSGIAMTILAFALFLLPSAGVAIAFAAVSLFWAVGVWISVAPRPKSKMMMIDPLREWHLARICARVSQWFWPIAGTACASSFVTEGTLSSALAVASIACAIIGLVGWWPAGAILSNLAYWASDTELADRLRNASWITAFGFLASAAYLALISAGYFGGRLGGFLILVAWTGGIIVPAGYGLVALWQLWRMSHWVLLNHVTAAARDDRLIAKAAKAVVKDAARNPIR
ncbi:MAG: hypothetical protein K2W85_05440 [Phycisphaerales bacterium]|nr:hypothetical protein [Phycisphaerales bacterium]